MWNITRISTVKLLFSFCANAHPLHCQPSLSRFPCAPTVLFCKQKLLNRLSITHDPRLRKHCILSDRLTLPQGKINWCQTWLGNTQGVRFSQFALCIPRSSADIFTHIILGKYLEATQSPRYNGVAVYSESRTFRRFEPIWFFLSQFLFSWTIGECQREPCQDQDWMWLI